MINQYTFLHKLPDVPLPFVNPVTIKQSWNMKQLEPKPFGSMVSRIEINPMKPDEILSTFNNRVRVLDLKLEEVHNISNFKDAPYGASYRRDGELIVVGGEDSVVKVIDPNTKNILRKFVGHNGAVHVSRFIDKLQIFTGSNDSTVRIWDIQTGEQSQLVGNHKDQVRSSCQHPTNSGLWLTGGYDHILKLWDIRSTSHGQASITLDHGAPVEDVVMLKNGTIAISAGGTSFKVWDLVAGKEVYTGTHHTKTVTSLFVKDSGNRFFTAGLDHMVKVFSTQSYSIINTIQFKEPILSLGFTDNKVYAGSTSGTIFVARKSKKVSVSKVKTSLKQKKEQGDVINEKLNIYKSSQIDLLLRKFEHKAAFDTSCYVNKNKDIFFKVICELSRRESLDSVLKNRDPEALSQILNMVKQLLLSSKYQQCGIMMMEKLVDIYQSTLVNDQNLKKTYYQIKTIIKNELRKQKKLLSISGALELIYNNQLSITNNNQNNEILPTTTTTTTEKATESENTKEETKSTKSKNKRKLEQ
eukprot:gene7388-9078_t